MHKRKHRKQVRDDNGEQPNIQQQTSSAEDPGALDPCLYIQAHEADVIRGPRALSARSLEYRDPLASGNDSGSGLIRWGLSERPDDADPVDTRNAIQPLLWVDRYDVRLLLDDLSDLQVENIPMRPLSPSGWSDLPSDSEDTFFFSPDELEDYRREKRRRLVDRGREERLRALAAIDGQEEDPDPWGGSDEEPDEAQKELIRRTASHVISSPNPAQLEMRILANYGTDKRFAFLRGRWSRVWRTEKERAKQSQVEESKKAQLSMLPTSASLGGLASYGDSDSNDGESADEGIEESKGGTDIPCATEANEDVVKEARRARAKEWSARRRAAQSLHLEEE